MSTSVRQRETERPRTRRFRGQTPEERKDERRKRLVLAGLQAFGTRGFHGAGVREICAEAKLTERYFYESFENREALFLAVYDHSVHRTRAAIAAAIKHAREEGADVPRAGLGVFLRLLKEDPRLARVLLVDVLTIGQDVGQRSVLASQSFAELVATVTSGVHPALSRDGCDVRLIANGLVGSTLFLVMQWVQGGFREPLTRILDHAALFYDSLAATLGTAPRGAPAPRRALPSEREGQRTQRATRGKVPRDRTTP